jgi:hypothetical protein
MSHLGIKKGVVHYHQKKLLKSHVLKQISPYPAIFAKGRYWRRWHSRCSNLNILVEGVVQTRPAFVRIEQMQFKLLVQGLPDDLPEWDGSPWEWGNGVICYPKELKLSTTNAKFTFMGKETIAHAKLQLEPFNIPASEIDNAESIKRSIVAEAIDKASKTWGFAFFRFAEPTTDSEYAFELPNLRNIKTGEHQLTEHYKINDSPIDGKRGTPMVETKSPRHAKALAERGEAVVRLEDVANGNRSGILGLAKRMDDIESAVLSKVDDKIARAIEKFGTVVTNAFDKLPDEIAKKLNKTYEPDDDDVRGYQ